LQFTGTIPEFLYLRAAYDTSLTLCTPAATETPEPAACGNHHIFRISPYWLVIMRLPMKSISNGLTCVAPYSTPECENGRNIGLPSTPYPSVIARRVDHASNAAAPLPAADSAYHNFLCVGFSLERVAAGFNGANGITAGPGSIAAAGTIAASAASSASVFTFGSGADATGCEREESSLEAREIRAEAVIAIFAVSPLCGMGNSNKIAANSMNHLRGCEPANFGPRPQHE
jgi:hypothetical protein